MQITRKKMQHPLCTQIGMCALILVSKSPEARAVLSKGGYVLVETLTKRHFGSL
jgi:hypothetical protein